MALPVLREHTDGIISRLQALGLTVGDAQAPASAPPYVVVYQITGGRTEGPLATPHDDAEVVYQVTCVGTSRKQTEWLADKVIQMVSGVTVTGRVVLNVDPTFGGVTRDDTTNPPLYLAYPRFRVYTTPS